MRTWTLLLCFVFLHTSSFTGTAALSKGPFTLLMNPDKYGMKFRGESGYNMETDEDAVDELVKDIVDSNYMDDDAMRKSLSEFLREREDLEWLRSKSKESHPTEPPQQSEGESFLERGIKFLRGLLGGDHPAPTVSQPTQPPTLETSPSSEDEAIMNDIETYLGSIAGSKNGTLDKILRYIVSYVHRNVYFWLFTRNADGYEDLWLGRASNVTKTGFDASKKTIMLVHGWVNAGDNFYAQNMIKALDAFGDYNIISVDWSELSYNLYTLSRLSVNFVGPYVAQMINFLANNHDLKVSELHILGHSLGAHIAGIAGMFVKEGQVGRITGFDPASPLFSDDQKYRLDAMDAEFVDVIHTSVFGMSEHLGHADFYPNGGGPSQPGCGIDVAICPHRRSYIYYIASLTDNNFLSYLCDSWEKFSAGNCSTHSVLMGVHAPKRARGKFYLKTSGQPPYALGNKTLEREVRQSSPKRA